MTMVPYGAALFLYLKIGTVTLEIIFMEHRMLQTK